MAQHVCWQLAPLGQKYIPILRKWDNELTQRYTQQMNTIWKRYLLHKQQFYRMERRWQNEVFGARRLWLRLLVGRMEESVQSLVSTID